MLRFLILMLISAFLSSCAHKTKSQSKVEVAEDLQLQSELIHSIQGRVWISYKDKEHSISFPSDIYIDRGNAKLRIDILGPFNVTYHQLVLNGEKLTWTDFDQKQKFTFSKKWKGLPLKGLVDFMSGLVQKSLMNDAAILQEVSFIDKCERNGLLSMSDAKGNFKASMSDHVREQEVCLPQEILIESKDGLLLRMNWRQKEFNKAIDPKVFIPTNLKS